MPAFQSYSTNQSFKKPMVLALCNGKGGSNKTTASISLSAEMAIRGFQVLLVDLCHSGDATKSLLEEGSVLNGSIAEVLLGNMLLLDVIVPTVIPTLRLLPADNEMRGFDQRLLKATAHNYAYTLAHVLESQAGGFDFIFLDCPGDLNALTIVALVAAKAFVVPCEPEYFSLEGAKSMVEVSHNIQKIGLAKNLIFAGLFFSPFDSLEQNDQLQDQMVEEANKLFPGQIFSHVRSDSGIHRSQVQRVPLAVLDPEARAVQDYRVLADEIILRVRKLMADAESS